MILFGIITKGGNGLLVKASKSRRPQWCSRKYLGTGAVQNISMVLFLEREH